MANKEKTRAAGNSKSGNQSGHIVQNEQNTEKSNDKKPKKGEKPAGVSDDVTKNTKKSDSK